MGSGTSKTPEQKAQEVRQKLAIVKALDSRPVKPSEESKRDSVYDFVNKRKAEKSKDWQQLQEEYNDPGEKRSSLRPDLELEKRQKEKEKEEQDNELYSVPTNIETDPTCVRCGEATMYRVDGYECRVCGKVFHKPCLQKTGMYTDSELAFVDRAFTNIGWSCHECDNIYNLLSNDEMTKISEAFEIFDIDRDGSVDIEEFIKFQNQQYKKTEGRNMNPKEEEFERYQFKQLDSDSSGAIDYWEFTKHEAAKVLALKPKVEQVALLTPREKRAAQMVFDQFDENKDGTIDALESKMAFRGWYNFASDKIPNTRLPPIKPRNPTIATHVISGANMENAEEADEDDDASISWREFLRSQAIYILSSRPNKVNVNVGHQH